MGGAGALSWARHVNKGDRVALLIQGDGGTHLTGFRQALTRTINAYATSANLTKDLKQGLQGADLSEGLTAITRPPANTGEGIPPLPPSIPPPRRAGGGNDPSRAA